MVQSVPSSDVPAADVPAAGPDFVWRLFASWRTPGAFVTALVATLTVALGAGQPATAQTLTATGNPYAALDNGIVATEAAMDSARSIERIVGRIRALAQRAQDGVTAPQTLAQQASSLGEQIDILATDAGFSGINLIGPGAKPHSVTLPNRRVVTVPAMSLTSDALSLATFDFGSPAGIGSAITDSDAALATAKRAAATYQGQANKLRAQRPSGSVGSRPGAVPSGSGGNAGGGLDIDALHNRLGIKKP